MSGDDVTRAADPPPPAQAYLVDGQQRYRVDGRLGTGGFGVVFKCWHEQTATWVAIKRLGVSETDAADLMREATRLGDVNSEYIAKPRACFYDETESLLYIVSDLASEGDLRQWLANNPSPLPVPTAIDLALGIARGLAALHARGILHRDLKPANILMYQRDNRVVPRLGDFGLARSGGSVSLNECVSVGYSAPEQLAFQRSGPESDLFSLGIVIYELMTGQRVTQARELSDYAAWLGTLQERPLLPPSSVRPELASWPGFDAVTASLIGFDRAGRQQTSAAQVVRELEMMTAGEPARVLPPASPTRTRRGVSVLWASLAAILLTALSGGISYLVYSPQWSEGLFPLPWLQPAQTRPPAPAAGTRVGGSAPAAQASRGATPSRGVVGDQRTQVAVPRAAPAATTDAAAEQQVLETPAEPVASERRSRDVSDESSASADIVRSASSSPAPAPVPTVSAAQESAGPATTAQLATPAAFSSSSSGGAGVSKGTAGTGAPAVAGHWEGILEIPRGRPSQARVVLDLSGADTELKGVVVIDGGRCQGDWAAPEMQQRGIWFQQRMSGKDCAQFARARIERTGEALRLLMLSASGGNVGEGTLTRASLARVPQSMPPWVVGVFSGGNCFDRESVCTLEIKSSGEVTLTVKKRIADFYSGRRPVSTPKGFRCVWEPGFERINCQLQNSNAAFALSETSAGLKMTTADGKSSVNLARSH